MPFAALPDADIHYEIMGSGPPLVLVSGLGGVASYWAPNVEALAKHHTVVVYDHRGCGRSTKSETIYSVEAMTEDFLGLMRVLGLGRVAILGHSTGGAIGQIAAARAPGLVDRLVLYASWAVLCPQMRQCLLMRQEALHAGGAAAYHRASPVFLYPPVYACAAWEAIAAETAAATAATTTPAILDARLDAIMAFDGRPYLGAIAAPTTIVVAQDDILTPPLCSDVLAQGITGARLTTLSYGAHAVSRVEPAIFNAAALGALAA